MFGYVGIGNTLWNKTVALQSNDNDSLWLIHELKIMPFFLSNHSAHRRCTNYIFIFRFFINIYVTTALQYPIIDIEHLIHVLV